MHARSATFIHWVTWLKMLSEVGIGSKADDCRLNMAYHTKWGKEKIEYACEFLEAVYIIGIGGLMLMVLRKHAYWICLWSGHGWALFSSTNRPWVQLQSKLFSKFV